MRNRSYPKFKECNLGKAKKGRFIKRMVARAKPGDQSRGLLIASGRIIEAAFGKGGITSIKREGDGATPLGVMGLISVYVRRGRLQRVRCGLKVKAIGSKDGWCDAPGDRNYNRRVPVPYPASHEKMLRDDHLYDVVVVLDANIRPRRQGMGSAIFFHLARPDYAPTEGCVAIRRQDMDWLLPRLSPRTKLHVVR